MSKIDNSYSTTIATVRKQHLKDAIKIILHLDAEAEASGESPKSWFRDACFNAKEGLRDILFATGEEQ